MGLLNIGDVVDKNFVVYPGRHEAFGCAGLIVCV